MVSSVPVVRADFEPNRKIGVKPMNFFAGAVFFGLKIIVALAITLVLIGCMAQLWHRSQRQHGPKGI
jgi:hypothetical protein